MDHKADPLVIGAMALFAGFIGVFSLFSPREYRDLIFRLNGSWRLMPEWFIRFQKSDANVWVIRLSGLFAIGMAVFLAYTAYRTP
jgi:hypothetical protein